MLQPFGSLMSSPMSLTPKYALTPETICTPFKHLISPCNDHKSGSHIFKSPAVSYYKPDSNEGDLMNLENSSKPSKEMKQKDSDKTQKKRISISESRDYVEFITKPSTKSISKSHDTKLNHKRKLSYHDKKPEVKRSTRLSKQISSHHDPNPEKKRLRQRLSKRISAEYDKNPEKDCLKPPSTKKLKENASFATIQVAKSLEPKRTAKLPQNSVTSMKVTHMKTKAELKAFDAFAIMKSMDERVNRPMMRCDVEVSDTTDHQTEIKREPKIEE